jgi:prepilin-type N-terminal cleavage/methylation domain-containing protein/prepilin-type processing-associated H-X9-DG protein
MIAGKLIKRASPRRGFTLVELLVVIGIIALLISILIPALNKARKAANTVECASNLRQIVQAMFIYVSQNNNYIPGSPNTTGAFLFLPQGAGYPTFGGNGAGAYSEANCPGICQTWDWESPIATMMGVSFNQNSDAVSRAQRFHFLNNYGAFTCPENQFIATEYPPDQTWLSGVGLTAVTDLMPSYILAEDFLLLPLPKGAKDTVPVRYGNFEGGGVGTTTYNDFVLPSNYTPKITFIGHSAQKIYISDGGKYSEGGGFTTNSYPNYVMSFSCDAAAAGGGVASGTGATEGGAYADYGAWDHYSRALCRTNAPGNGGPGGAIDGRVYGFRHGNQQPFGIADSYKFNAGFYDGHVETLGDLEGSNPNFWNPSGTICNNGAAGDQAICNDTSAKFCGGAGPTYTVP